MIDGAGEALTRLQSSVAAREECSQVGNVVAVDCSQPNGDAPAMSVLPPAGNENLVLKRLTLAWVLPVGCAVTSLGGRGIGASVEVATESHRPPLHAGVLHFRRRRSAGAQARPLGLAVSCRGGWLEVRPCSPAHRPIRARYRDVSPSLRWSASGAQCALSRRGDH